MDKNHLKSLLAQGKIKDVLDQLKQAAAQTDELDLQNSLIHVEGQFNSLKKMRVTGTISDVDSQIEQQKVVLALITLIDDFPEKGSTSFASSSFPNKFVVVGGILFVLVAVLGVSLFVRDQGEMRKSRLEEEAKLAFSKEKFAQAGDLFEILLEKYNPDDPDYLEKYGYALFRTQEYQKAIDNFSRAIELSQDSAPQLYYFRGLVYARTGRPELALPDFDKLLRLAPARKFGYLERGRVHLSLKDTTKACSDFEMALRYQVREATPFHRRYCGERSVNGTLPPR